MPLTKTKKRRKSSRFHGRGMGSSGRGYRKRGKGKGHKGGKGMSGTGKRADHKKTLVLNLYGHGYFGKQGITSKGTKRDKRDRINLRQIETNLNTYVKKGLAKKTSKGFEVDLKKYKVLGVEENFKLKHKLFIKAKEASKSAIENVKSSGGEIILSRKSSELKKDSEE